MKNMVSNKLLSALIFLKRNFYPKYHNVHSIFNVSRNYSMVASSFKFSDLQIKIATEAQKMKKPELENLVFGETFSDHMFEVEWNRTSGWGVPRIVPLHNFQCHPGSKVFHYGQALFEGMKAFRQLDGSVAFFRPEMNMQRMLLTAERAAFPSFDGKELLKCLKKLVSIDKDWIPHGANSALYVRPTLIGTQNSLGVNASNSALLFIITGPVGSYFTTGEAKPVGLLADPKYVRAWPGGVGDKKMASNYSPTLYVQKLAQERGLQQVLWLFGEDHRVCEVGSMNVFFLFQKDNELELATPPLDGTILPGVVRHSVLELTRQYNEFKVSERHITMGEILTAHEKGTLLEMFGTGTACSVCPVDYIKFLDIDIKIPTVTRENPLCLRLYKELTDIQYGRVSSNWSVKVD